MFIEINDISTGTAVQETLNSYSINYVYSKQEGGKYLLIYVLVNGIRKVEEFNSQSDLDDRIEEIGKLRGNTKVYTYKGSCTFENLPTSGQVAGDVYNVTNDFTLDGKPYPAGTNVAWDGAGWDALAGSFTVPVISNAEIDNLFLADLLFGYTSEPIYGEEYSVRIANGDLSFPQENFRLDGNFYECLNTSLEGTISCGNVSATLTYDMIFIEKTQYYISYTNTPETIAVLQANGGSLIGITFEFDAPANLFSIGGIGNKARHARFTIGDPIDGHQYPSS